MGNASVSKYGSSPSITGSLPFDGRWLVGSTPAITNTESWYGYVWSRLCN